MVASGIGLLQEADQHHNKPSQTIETREKLTQEVGLGVGVESDVQVEVPLNSIYLCVWSRKLDTSGR